MRGVNTLDSKEQGNFKNFAIGEVKEDKEKNAKTTTQVELRDDNIFMRTKSRKIILNCCGL
ncbi:hypothetical protein LCGC14_1562830 [marine sediment metagenome]|uniref:Uncharacterized protein n=1 Tax=marine sediment metagenome TaxID=412755 RepID=A0A0F9ILY3_9ZZZZ